MSSAVLMIHASAIFVPHGGGPLPLLGDVRHAAMAEFLRGIGVTIGNPEAIVVVSPHWESDHPTVTAAEQPNIIYDYTGFPPESYVIDYPAPGAPWLAEAIAQRLADAGLMGHLDARRGFDHGLFVPLKLMYPDASIPCVQLSLLRGLDSARHIALGRVLAGLRHEGILVVGSGMSFHNMPYFFAQQAEGQAESEAFHRWLITTCTDPQLSLDERKSRLIAWERAPSARFCHPRAEHLMPLHVCFGAAGLEAGPATVVFDQAIMDRPAVALMWA